MDSGRFLARNDEILEEIRIAKVSQNGNPASKTVKNKIKYDLPVVLRTTEVAKSKKRGGCLDESS